MIRDNFTLPDGWQWYKLDNLITRISNGISENKDDIEGLPVTRIETISHGTVNLKKVGFLKNVDSETVSKYRLLKGDILFSHINSDSHIGKTAIFDLKDTVLLHGINLLLIRSNQKLVIPKFLNYVLNFYRKIGIFAHISNHAVNQASINQANLKNIDIALPSIKKQNDIVTIFDKLNNLKLKKLEIQKFLDDITHSVFIQMFGDPLTNPMKWGMLPMKNIIVKAQYGTSSKLDTSVGVPCLRMNNIKTNGNLDVTDLKYLNEKDEVKKYLLNKGDVLFNRTNSKELIGKTTIFDLDDAYTFAGYLIRLITDKGKCEPYFLFSQMNLPEMKAKIRSMAKHAINQSNINATEIQKLSIILPPRNLQVKFNKILQKIRIISAKTNQSINLYEKLIDSTQSKLLNFN